MRDKCPFCEIEGKKVIFKNDYAYVKMDEFPVSKGHLLVIPFRHFDDYFKSTKQEKESISKLIDYSKEYLDEKYRPDGYNIGVNIGVSAGQTIMHLHIHVIPRYENDVLDPTGGVRNVIPEKGNYLK